MAGNVFQDFHQRSSFANHQYTVSTAIQVVYEAVQMKSAHRVLGASKIVDRAKNAACVSCVRRVIETSMTFI